MWTRMSKRIGAETQAYTYTYTLPTKSLHSTLEFLLNIGIRLLMREFVRAQLHFDACQTHCAGLAISASFFVL